MLPKPQTNAQCSAGDLTSGVRGCAERWLQERVIFRQIALTQGNNLSNTSAHDDFERTYRGGNAHGQDGVTIRR